MKPGLPPFVFHVCNLLLCGFCWVAAFPVYESERWQRPSAGVPGSGEAGDSASGDGEKNGVGRAIVKHGRV